MEQPITDNASPILNGMPASAIRAELNRILRSRVFVHSHRIRRFLQFVVEECILGQQHRLKEYLIGLEVFNRVEAFDPRVDSIVRVEARRLRAKIDEYYQTEGREDEIRIELRKGSYVPIFEYRRSGYQGYSLAPIRRSSIAIGSFSTHNGEPPELVSDVTRRLTHVLINEGYCQVVAPPNGNGDGAAHGHAPFSGAPADYVLEGTVQQDPTNVNVLLRLMNVSDRTYLWSESGSLDGLDVLARSMNRAVVTSYTQSGAGHRLQRHRSQSQSLDHYLHGRYLWKRATPETVRSSIGLFAKAVERDPSYAAAWAALAEASIVTSVFGFMHPAEVGPKIKEAAQKAIQLNDALPEAHVALGAALSIFDRDWDAGEREFQRAFQLDGRDSSLHIAYGLQLACRGMLNTAAAEIDRALELDPASLSSNFVKGWLSGVSRRHDEAIAQHSLISHLAPDFPLAYLGLGWAHAGKGQFGDAIACFTNAGNLLKCGTLLSGCLGFCYARMGNRHEAMRLLAQLTSQPTTVYTSPVSMAAICSGLGEIDRSFSYLNQAADLLDSSLALHLLNPEFDSLRGLPQFGLLMQKLGLTASQAVPA